MWKSLIEKLKGRNRRKGYTLTELLVVIGIVALVCAIAIPSVIFISRTLKFKQRNDYAKTIFMAAQANLSEMRSDGGLTPLQQSGIGSYDIAEGMSGFPAEHWSDEYQYTTSRQEDVLAYSLVLPAGSVESALRDQQVIIEYNPITGNVYSVFYSEERESIVDQYTGAGLPRSSEADRKKMMLGYYDGSGLSSSQLELESAKAEVEFSNGQEGIVTVRIPMPSLYYGDHSSFMEGLWVKLTVIGETSNGTFDVVAKEVGAIPENCILDVDGKTVLVTYALDSLKDLGSFANLAAAPSIQTLADDETIQTSNSGKNLSEYLSEEEFLIKPGENVTILADVEFTSSGNKAAVTVEDGALSGINPMFAALEPSATGSGYILTVANGRNLQNLNAIAPSVADTVDTVVFADDIYWNETVTYYNEEYGVSGATYINNAAEAPGRSLPYFVPIHNENLFGTARFIFPGEGDGGLGGIIGDILGSIFGNASDITVAFTGNKNVPTLTDELDNNLSNDHATIQGGGHKVYNINIDSTKYAVPNEGETGTKTNEEGETYTADLTGTFYATGANQLVDYNFTGLFGYINTSIDDLHVVNPIVKGHEFTYEETLVPIYLFGWIVGYETETLYNNPATGALVGATGFNTWVTNCSVYIDTEAPGFTRLSMGQSAYDADAVQNWYGVSGEGAVGGLVGYAKSHRTVEGTLTNDLEHLAFSSCFAAVNVSGNMRGSNDKHFGYSNGVGGLIGNSQLTNFYNCYASGNVIASGCRVNETLSGSIANNIAQYFGIKLDLLYNGRTSMGAGGFVGTSHGTRYTNCFATGEVTAASRNSLGAGGFVGFMAIDETFSYGNDSGGHAEIAQRTVFTNCYSVGLATTNGTPVENFSGANGRIAFNFNQAGSYLVGDYYRLYAPHYSRNNGQAPGYEDIYIYRDTYYLSNYYDTAQDNSNNCASAEPYSTFTDLPGSHRSSTWIQDHVNTIKQIKLTSWSNNYTYDTQYFTPHSPTLENIYKDLFNDGYQSGWESATEETTHPYSQNAAGARYPFSKLAGMDYYGDWPSKPSAVGLAYYESYEGTEGRAYYYDRDSTSELTEDPEALVVEDGFAVLSATSGNVTVRVGDNSTSTTLVKEDETFRPGNADTVAPYHVFLLTEEVLQEALAESEDTESFYIKLTITNAEGDSYVTYFNPSVALTQVNPTDGNKSVSKPAKIPTQLYIRSARQLAALSENENIWSEDYNYVQQLNIDAGAYDWADEDAENETVGTIGTKDKPFNGTYSGNGGYVEQAKIVGFEPSEGFFGVIGNTGTIRNLQIGIGKASSANTTIAVGKAATESVGILAGVNRGTVENVDLTAHGIVTVTAKTNAGLLIGLNESTTVSGKAYQAAISDSSVIAATATVNAPNAGGLVGASAGGNESNTAAITDSTVAVEMKLSSNGTEVGGFVGSAQNTEFENIGVEVTALTASAAEYAGGFAGSVSNSEVTTLVVTLSGTNRNSAAATTAKPAYMAGAAGKAVSSGFTKLTVELNSKTKSTLSGDIAAGMFGIADKATVNNASALLPGTISGTNGAAGIAGTVEAGSVFENASVTLAGGEVTASGGKAAGYALEFEGTLAGGNVYLGTYTKNSGGKWTSSNSAAIKGKTEAAGFACAITVSNSNTFTSGTVSGAGTISSDDKAAGFVISVSGSGGQIGASHVTPAASHSAAAYLGNGNSNLTVNGKTAAGFALDVGSGTTVSNSYTLCKITGTTGYGFARSNMGTITGCTSNVTLTGGYAFVGTNDGTVSRCYGWYGDNVEKDSIPTKVYVDGESGNKCYSSYFVDMDIPDTDDADAVASVTLFDTGSVIHTMTPTMLAQQSTLTDLLNSDATRWYATGTYKSYSYTTIQPSTYRYPMLRDHCGDWVTLPQYAYGVAYYEIYEGGSYKVHVMDVSDPAVTKSMDVPDYSADPFNGDGAITDAGYALFCKAGTNPFMNQNGQSLLTTETLSIAPGNWNDTQKARYTFYKVNPDAATKGVLTVSGAETLGSEVSVSVMTCFADEFNGADGNYQVRTAAQLANVSQYPAAAFTQTHDITTGDFTNISDFTGTYTGAGFDITATAATQSWITGVNGAVTIGDLTVNSAGAVSAPVFGTVNQAVTLGAVTTGAADSLIFSAVGTNGSVTAAGVTTGAIGANGGVFGTVSGNVTVNGNITTNKAAVSGQIFGDISGKDKLVKVTGSISTGDVEKQIFGKVASAVQTGSISVGAVNGQVFGEISANVTVNGMTTGAVAANKSVITKVGSGTVTTGAIAASSVSGSIIGEVSGGTVQGGTTAAAIHIKSGDAYTAVGNALIGTVGSGAAVKNYTINTGKLTASVVNSLTGELNTVTVNATSAELTTGMLVNALNKGGIINNCVATTSEIAVNNVAAFGVITASVPGGATVQNTTVKVNTITVSDLEATIGGLVGTNAGAISGCVVQNKTADGNAVMKLGSDSDAANTRNLVVGGLVGSNSGEIKNTDASHVTASNVAITYNQAVAAAASLEEEVQEDAETLSAEADIATAAAVPGETVTIGGLVGSNSGTINGAAVNGSIATNASASGKSYIIGGAVGKDEATADTDVEYKDINAVVTIDSDWAGAKLVNTVKTYSWEQAAASTQAVCPGGFGPVGKFVGYVSDGTFQNCSSIGSETEKSYQFLGEIKASEANLAQISLGKDPAGKVDSFTEECADTSYQPSETASWTDWYEGEYTTDTTYRTFGATLENCKFDREGKGTVTQTLNSGNYFFYKHSGEDVKLQRFKHGDKIENMNFAGTSYSFKDTIYPWVLENGNGLTDFYYLENGVYYRVTVSATSSSTWWGENKRSVTISYGSSSLTANGSRGMLSSWSWDKSSCTLYTVSESVDTNNTHTLISEDGTKMLAVQNGTVTAVDVSDFTENAADTQNGYLWKRSGSGFVLANNSSTTVSASIELLADSYSGKSQKYTIDGIAYYLHGYTESSHGYQASFVLSGEFNHICSYE